MGSPRYVIYIYICYIYIYAIYIYMLYYIYIYIYGTPPHGPWFGAVDLYFPVFYAYFCFLDLCQNWGEGRTCI